jgi:putative cell wall-binding protein
VDCYATAAAISAWGFKTSGHVVLASGENFPDALAGTTLAAMKDAPILLTARDVLSSETLAEIKRLKAKTIYLLGGTAVISTKVEEALAREYTVIRIAGWDKYETAVRIGELVGSVDTAIISAGSDYPDALSIAPFAGQYGLPILFTEQDELNALTIQALNQWGVKNVILTGGSSVISARVENILRNEMKLNVTRLCGVDRYLTGLEIAKYFAAYSTDGVSNADITGNTGIIDSDDCASRQTSYPYAALATGINFPDALAGAALAAKLKMPVLLTGKENISPDVRDYLKELNLKKLYVFGGWAVIADKLVEEISRKD